MILISVFMVQSFHPVLFRFVFLVVFGRGNAYRLKGAHEDEAAPAHADGVLSRRIGWADAGKGLEERRNLLCGRYPVAAVDPCRRRLVEF